MVGLYFCSRYLMSVITSLYCITMADLHNKIVVSSMNARSLTEYKKKYDVIQYFKELKTDIVCLQDMHWLENQVRHITAMWNGPCLISGSHTNARGLAIC